MKRLYADTSFFLELVNPSSPRRRRLIEVSLTDALTTDHHFEQAGFVAMLK